MGESDIKSSGIFRPDTCSVVIHVHNQNSHHFRYFKSLSTTVGIALRYHSTFIVLCDTGMDGWGIWGKNTGLLSWVCYLRVNYNF